MAINTPDAVKRVSDIGGRAIVIATQSPKLRAALAAMVVGACAKVGLDVDNETAVALILLAGTLAGWGPDGAKAA